MTSNVPYHTVPIATPVVAQTVVVPAQIHSPRSQGHRILIGIAGAFLCFMGLGLVIVGAQLIVNISLLSGGVYIIFGMFIMTAGMVLCKNRRCPCVSSSSGQVIGQAPVPTQNIVAPAGYYPATSTVQNGFMSSYTYSPNSQPTAGQLPPSVPLPAGHPPPTLGPAPPYPYAAGGQLPSFPTDPKAASAGAPVGFQGPPSSPYSPEYQPPPSYNPGDLPPPYSK